MSGLDVEALLESTAKAAVPQDTETSHSNDGDDRLQPERAEKRDRDNQREESRDRDRDRDRKRRDRSKERRRDRGIEHEEELKSPRGDRGGHHNRHRTRRNSNRSREADRRGSRRDRRWEAPDREDLQRSSAGGDYYRGAGRPHTRSRSPDDDRYYRPAGRGRRDRDNRDRQPESDRRKDPHRDPRAKDGDKRRPESPGRSKSPKRARTKSASPQLNEDERDRRTVFVQQLAARLRTKELITFFEKVGPVKEAQIVKDRVSGRSKGSVFLLPREDDDEAYLGWGSVGYVEFKDEKYVQPAIQLTGQKLLGIPIIAQLTEAEKNRQARTGDGSSHNNQSSIPFHRLYVGNIHFSITESDLQNVFEPFGELEFVQLQKEELGRSRGYGFVQFRDPNQAREALEKMNGFDLAGRPIRVGLGNDKFTPESTANLLQRFHGHGVDQRNFQGSAFSGHGGRGAHAGGSGGAFDRAGGRDGDKGAGGASALDDTDVAGVNFNNYSRDALMRKLARTDDPAPETNGNEDKRKVQKPTVDVKPIPANVIMASRCVVLKNMFDPAEEEGDAWVKELEDDVRAECEQKYGHVVHISLDPNSQGDIYLKFDRVEGGENAIKGLNGRFFGGRQISATPVVDAVYSSLFTRTKAI